MALDDDDGCFSREECCPHDVWTREPDRLIRRERIQPNIGLIARLTVAVDSAGRQYIAVRLNQREKRKFRAMSADPINDQALSIREVSGLPELHLALGRLSRSAMTTTPTGCLPSDIG